MHTLYLEANERNDFLKIAEEEFLMDDDDILAEPNPIINFSSNKIGRNELCPCDSGRKYEKCCFSMN